MFLSSYTVLSFPIFALSCRWTYIESYILWRGLAINSISKHLFFCRRKIQLYQGNLKILVCGKPEIPLDVHVKQKMTVAIRFGHQFSSAVVKSRYFEVESC